MFPEIFIFGIKLPTYGLISFFGFLVAAFVGLRLIGKRNVQKQDFLYISVVSGFGVVAGANFLYALTRVEDIVEVFARYNSFTEIFRELYYLCGGMVFYGGLYGGLLAGFLFAKYKKYPLEAMTDVFAVLIPLFHTFGRVGCFFAGCCYGVKCDLGFSGRVITANIKESVKRLPIQLIEAFTLLCLFLILLFLFKRKRAEGRLIFVYLVSYATIRFVLEFFRGDEVRGHLFILSTSQWISIITLVWVLVYLLIKNTKNKTKV